MQAVPAREEPSPGVRRSGAGCVIGPSKRRETSGARWVGPSEKAERAFPLRSDPRADPFSEGKSADPAAAGMSFRAQRCRNRCFDPVWQRTGGQEVRPVGGRVATPPRPTGGSKTCPVRCLRHAATFSGYQMRRCVPMPSEIWTAGNRRGFWTGRARATPRWLPDSLGPRDRRGRWTLGRALGWMRQQWLRRGSGGGYTGQRDCRRAQSCPSPSKVRSAQNLPPAYRLDDSACEVERGWRRRP